MKLQAPINWNLIEEYDGNYIFRNAAETMHVYIGYDPQCDFPYSIDFTQIKGIFVLWPIEEGAYVTHSKKQLDAFEKALQMMAAIDIGIKGKEVII